MSTGSDWLSKAAELGREFAARAAEHDENDSFVAENYSTLKEQRFFSAGVPAELGGGGLTHVELAAVIRELARHCSATALAFSMHTHQIATLAWMFRNGNTMPEPLLRRVAAENLILIASGGSDWLNSSGKLEKVDGGYRFNARKVFASGVPAGDLLMTGGIYDDPEKGPTVIHFPLSLKAEGVKVMNNWKTLGMRGTASHDVEIKDVFLPDAAMGGLQRPSGKWHPFFHAVCLIAVPVFNSAYLGVAQAARDLAIKISARKKDEPGTAFIVGELENAYVTAQIAHQSMIELSQSAKPGPEATSAMMVRRTIFGTAALRTVDKALEAAGGVGFYRAAGLERLFRDIQGVRYHPLQEKPQLRLTGRVLLGLDIDG